jgi:rod shape-determining protein MreC
MTRSKSGWLWFGIILAILLLGLALGRLGYLQPVQGIVRTIIAPVQGGMTDVGSGVGNLFLNFRDVRALSQRLSELQDEVNRLSVDNARLADIEQENRDLRQLLNFTRNNPQIDYRAAAVVGQKIGEDTSNLLFSIFIDVGARDGVARGMPVITDRGLVGRVVAVGPTVSEVLLIIDPSSSVNGRVQSSRATGVVRGSIEGGLTMERIPQGEAISPGDIVTTSGLGGNFPDKLVIGQITEIQQRDLDMFQSARIRPTVDFGRLEVVLVLVTFEPIDFEQELQPQEETNN